MQSLDYVFLWNIVIPFNFKVENFLLHFHYIRKYSLWVDEKYGER